ncbi:MAG: flippase-like domain-containing protein [Deltaproteobacteria bacterium]|nr:flippase-like domain-containing protein [Deltaproteobacteria bacterium]
MGNIEGKNKLLHYGRKLFPYILGIVILLYLINVVSLERFVDSLSRGRYDYFIPASIVFFFIVFLVDVLGTKLLIDKSVIYTSFNEMLIVKSISGLIGFLNQAIGQMSIGYYYHKKSGLPFFYVGGALLLLLFIDIVSLTIALGLSIKKEVIGVASFVPYLIMGLMMVIPVYLVVRFSIMWLFKNDKLRVSSLLMSNKIGQLLGALILIPFPDLITILIVRIPRIFLKAFYMVMALWFFNIKVPYSEGISLVILSLFIGAIPITPSGLGTFQGMSLILLERYGEKADILASTFASNMVFILGQVIMGLYYLNKGLFLLGDIKKQAEVSK